MISTLRHIHPQEHAHKNTHTSIIQTEDYFHQQIALEPTGDTIEI